MKGKHYDRSRTVREMQTLIYLLLLMILALLIVICAIRSSPKEEPAPQLMKPTLCVEPKQLLYMTPKQEAAGGGTETPAEPAAGTYIREDIPLSTEEQTLLHDAAEEFDVPYTLALAVVAKETNYRNIMGDGGRSYGYMQVQLHWWHDLMADIGVTDLLEPAQNFRTGCAVLRFLTDKNDGSIPDALTEYNTGYPGTSPYAAAVLEILDKLEAAGE